jgi:hypothetical protein
MPTGSSSRVLGKIGDFGHPFYGLARSGSLERAIAISTLVERAQAAKTKKWHSRLWQPKSVAKRAFECGTENLLSG